MTQRFGALTHLFTFAIFALSTHCAVAANHQQTSGGKHAEAAPGAGHKQTYAKPKGANSAHVSDNKLGKRGARKNGRVDVSQVPTPLPKPAPPQTVYLGALKQAMQFVRDGKIGEATVV